MKEEKKNSIIDTFKNSIREIPDFPKLGIIFKDITPVLANPMLCRDITKILSEEATKLGINAVAAIESRGFLFGMLLAQELKVPFIPVRKKGKLPYKTHSQSYNLEYGTAEVEIHIDAIKPNSKVLIHDDLLATGGTASATAKLIKKSGATIAGFSFLINLDFLPGKKFIKKYSENIFSLVDYI